MALYMADPASVSMTAESADLYELMKRTLVPSEFFVFLLWFLPQLFVAVAEAPKLLAVI